MAKKLETTEKMRLEDHPGFLEARTRVEQLQARKAELDARLLEAVDQGRRREALQSSLDQAAQAVLRGEAANVAAVAEEQTFRSLEREAAIVSRALDLANGQYQAVWQAASGAVVAARLPEHKALVADIREHLKGLVDAIRAEQAWVDGLRTTEGLYFTAGLGNTVNPGLGEAKQLFSMLKKFEVQAWKQRLKRHGY